MRGLLPIPLLVAALACSGSPTAPGGPQLSFTTVVSASHSGVTASRTQVVREDETWRQTWEEIHARQSERPARPAIDFGQEMLLLAALGERESGCYSVRITGVTDQGSRLVATVEEIVAGAGCACTQALTHPVHVVRLPRRSDPVEFETRRTVNRCS